MKTFNKVLRELNSLKFFFVHNAKTWKFELRDKRLYFESSIYKANKSYSQYFDDLCNKYFENIPAINSDKLRLNLNSILEAENRLNEVTQIYFKYFHSEKDNKSFKIKPLLLELLNVINLPNLNLFINDSEKEPFIDNNVNISYQLEQFLHFHRTRIKLIKSKIKPFIKPEKESRQIKSPEKLEDIIENKDLNKLVELLKEKGFVNDSFIWTGKPIEFAAMAEVCRTLIVKLPYRNNAYLLYKVWSTHFKCSTKEKRDKKGLLYIADYNYFKPAWRDQIDYKSDKKRHTIKFDFILKAFNTE
jgi:hypothetical protein